jgi:hypothetical protein
MYVQRKRRNHRFLLVAVSFHPAHPGIQIEVVLNPIGDFNGRLFLWKAFLFWNLHFIEEL